MTGGEIIARTLIEQRVRHVFGIPGALNAHLYDALRAHRDELAHVLVRHELGGSWMADGYARAGGDVGVVTAVPGPGVTHAASAIAGAHTDCSRVLLLSASSESAWQGELRRDLFHGLDQQRLLAGVTKWQTRVRAADEIAPALAEAFTRLRSGRPGPVHVEVPADVLGAEAGSEVAGYVDPRRSAADPALIEQAARLLREARRPLVLAGDGVLHAAASAALSMLAARLGAPVITTVLGKGAIPETDPWSLGDMNSDPGSEAYGAADLVLAVGTRFVQVDTRWPWFRPPRRLIHLDADRREIGRLFPPEVGIAADPRVAVLQLVEALGETDPGGGWQPLFPELKRRSDRREALPVLAALRRALPKEGVAAFDVCFPGFRSRSDWTAYRPGGYYYPGVYVGMGFGLPIAIGAALARPGSPALAVAGDGGFQMTMSELATAAQENVPVVIIVINDNGLTLIRRVQDRDFGGRRFAVDMANPDFVALGNAYGIRAERVSTPEALEGATREAIAAGGPALIEYELSS